MPYLPDELIQLIFEPVLLSCKRARHEDNEYLPANDYLALSKRFYRILRTIRFRELEATKSPRHVALLLARLVNEADMRTRCSN